MIVGCFLCRIITFPYGLYGLQACHKKRLYLCPLNRSRTFDLNSLHLILLDALSTLFQHYFYALKALKYR